MTRGYSAEQHAEQFRGHRESYYSAGFDHRFQISRKEKNNVQITPKSIINYFRKKLEFSLDTIIFPL